MKRTIYSLALILLGGQMLTAQGSKTISLSIRECMKMAVEKNITVKTARIDKEKNTVRKDELMAALLPKVNFNGSLQDNLLLPTTVLPGEFLGKPGTSIAVQMGSQYNATAALGVNLGLYNQTALTALKLSKKSIDLSGLSVQKASEDIAAEVGKLYFLTQTTAEQQKLIEENIARTERLRDITKITVDNGVSKQVDLDRVNVNLENYYTQLSNTQALAEQQINMIKYMLDIPLTETVILTDKADMLLLQNEPSLVTDFSNHVDIQLLESQKEINLLNQKIINNGYLPTLSFSGSFAYQGLRSDFNTYFQSGDQNKWYPSSNIGISVAVPLFDGFEKRSKFRQAKLETSKTLANMESAKIRLDMNYKNATNNYLNNQNIVRRQQQNQKLANKVFEETSLKYREGLASMSNLLQDEISLSNAQAGYLTALYNFKDAELKIMSLNGEIKNLIGPLPPKGVFKTQ